MLSLLLGTAGAYFAAKYRPWMLILVVLLAGALCGMNFLELLEPGGFVEGERMIKPYGEYTPEEREFVDYVQKLRSQPPRPQPPPGPIDWEEMKAIARQVPQADRDALVETIRAAKHR